jgi:hypothetical protein
LKKEADMWWRRTTLTRLRDELSTIELFDRVHDFATDSDPADRQAYELRQIRRLQIMAEIKKLTGVGIRRWEKWP